MGRPARPADRRTGAPARRRRLLAALAILAVAFLVVVEALLIEALGTSARTTRDFQHTTDATTAIANAQREALLLEQLVTKLRPGDSMADVALRRGLLDRQLEVVTTGSPGNREVVTRVRRARAALARFDAAVAAAYGRGDRAVARPGRTVDSAPMRRLERNIKRLYDFQEQGLYTTLRETLSDRARDQLLIVVLSAFALLAAAAVGFGFWRAIRGDFARAYGLLDRSEERFRRVVEQVPGIVYVLALHGDRALQYVSPQAESITGMGADEWRRGLAALAARVPAEDRARVAAVLDELAAGASPRPIEFRFVKPDGEEIWLREGGGVVRRTEDGPQLQGLLLDITAAKQAQSEREKMELELRLAQKLEAVGQLAAGIAHEINTPIQFVGDTLQFLRDGFADLMRLDGLQAELLEAARAGEVPPELIERVGEAAAIADLDYLRERVPAALDRGDDGIARVATIVRAMREFAHPATDKAPVDINAAVRNTLIVATHAYKYVADVETDLGDLPPVLCSGGDLNQVLINLIVNAAQAIEDKVGADGERGTIRIRTRRAGDQVVIRVADTGAGIPDAVAAHVFDPFFTTKEVGRGTGQGLAIARTLVVERHGGALTFETEPGRGTTFEVRLPIGSAAPQGAEALLTV